MYAGLRAGKPTLVVPQAFDQIFNAQLLESHGVGLRSSPTKEDLLEGIGTVLESTTMAKAAKDMSLRLVAWDRAAQRIANHLTLPLKTSGV